MTSTDLAIETLTRNFDRMMDQIISQPSQTAAAYKTINERDAQIAALTTETERLARENNQLTSVLEAIDKRDRETKGQRLNGGAEGQRLNIDTVRQCERLARRALDQIDENFDRAVSNLEELVKLLDKVTVDTPQQQVTQ